MSQENLDTLRGGYEAFGRGDLDAAFANFADDIVWRGPSELVPAGGTYHGRDEVRNQWLPEFTAHYQDFRQKPEQFIDAGEWIIVLGTGRFSIGGQEIKGSFAHIWKYAGGKVVEASFFADSARTLQAMQKQSATA
jgi:ketosteroid isomerase-like protein